MKTVVKPAGCARPGGLVLENGSSGPLKLKNLESVARHTGRHFAILLGRVVSTTFAVSEPWHS